MTSNSTNPGIDNALEPCPFCGGDEIIFKGPDGSSFSIICTNCCAEMPYMSLDDPQSVRWNTRVTASGYAELKREVERLRGWVEDAYLEGYSTGMTAGTITCREEDWARSKARAALQQQQGEE